MKKRREGAGDKACDKKAAGDKLVTRPRTHPGVVKEAGNLAVAEEGEHLCRGTGRDAEVIEEQPVGAAVGGAAGGGGGG